MAREAARNGGRSMPNNLAQGRGIYPIIPYRSQLGKVGSLDGAGGGVAAVITIDSNVVDFDLQFEDNEVMDIVCIESEVTVTDFELLQTSADNDQNLMLAQWLMENPELTATDVLGSVTTQPAETDEFMTNSALVWYHEEQYAVYEGTAGTAASIAIAIAMQTKYRKFDFPQPYTVARNVLHTMKGFLINDASRLNGYRMNMTIWGRRRKAADGEFKNIMYRQRF